MSLNYFAFTVHLIQQIFDSSSVDEDLDDVPVVSDEDELLYYVLLTLVPEQLGHTVPEAGSEIDGNDFDFIT